MNNSVKFVFFDVDDTLLDHKSAERAALQDTRSELFYLQTVEIEKIWDVYHHNNARLWKEYGAGKIDRQFLENSRIEWTLKDLGLDIYYTEEVRAIYMTYYKKHWNWIQGAKEALHEIAKIYPVGFLTNGFSEIQRSKSKAFDLERISSVYIISEDVGHMKPTPEIFDYATRMANVKPEEILYVGDSFHSDMEGGASFGWKTAWYTSDPDPVKARIPDLVFEDYSKLTAYLLV